EDCGHCNVLDLIRVVTVCDVIGRVVARDETHIADVTVVHDACVGGPRDGGGRHGPGGVCRIVGVVHSQEINRLTRIAVNVYVALNGIKELTAAAAHAHCRATDAQVEGQCP